MTTIQSRMHAHNTPWLGALAAGALIATAGCSEGLAARTNTQAVAGSAAQAMTMPAGSPIVVSCEPQQRTLVRPVMVNGAAVSQVECITDGASLAATTALPAGGYAAPVPVAYRQPLPAVTPVRYVPADDLPDARVIPVSQPATVARTLPARQVVYQEPIKPKRTVKKSAIIIGSSAGAGAGIGAAVGGKKGALIGAVIGGGGATLWDQITRR
jgi:hypothetical protein